MTLYLSHNSIKKIPELKSLKKLQTIELSHNNITSLEDCEGLLDLPEITSISLRNNQIEGPNTIISFFEKLPKLLLLYFKPNPCVRHIPLYRKNLIMAMPALQYLDERTIFEAERLTADAFKRGGKEEEERVRQEFVAREKARVKKDTDRGS